MAKWVIESFGQVHYTSDSRQFTADILAPPKSLLKSGPRERQQTSHRTARLVAAPQQNSGVDGPNGILDWANLDTSATRHSGIRHQRHHGYAKPRFHHTHNRLRAGCLER